MVRETRYLYVGNLPDPVTEEQITEYFGRHGRIQGVKLIHQNASGASVDNHDSRRCLATTSSSSSSPSSKCCAVAVVAFMDIRSASRAHESINVINGAQLVTLYNESSSAITCPPPPTTTLVAPSSSSSSSAARFVASSSTHALDSCSTSSSSKPGCLSPTTSSLPMMVQAAVPNTAAGPPVSPATVSYSSTAVGAGGGFPRTHSLSASQHATSMSSSSSRLNEGTNGPSYVADHESSSFSGSRTRTARRSTTPPTSPRGTAATSAVTSSSASNSHRHRRTAHRSHHHHHHHHHVSTGGSSTGSPAAANSSTVLSAVGGGTASGVVLSSAGRLVASGSGSYHAESTGCRSRSRSVSPPDTGRSRSQGSSCSGSHSHDRDGDRRLGLSNSSGGFHVRTAGSDSSGVSSSGSNGGSDPRKPRGMMIRGFPHRSTDSSIRDGLFHEYKKYGKVTSVSILGTGEDRHAVVSFKKHEDALKALEASQEKRFFGGKVSVTIHDGVEVENCEFRAPEAELDEYHHKATRTLFVGNLDKSVTKEMLRDIFTKFGQIVEIEIKNQGGQLLSYAFIQFDNIKSVVTALHDMDGEHVSGSKIKLGFGKSMPTTCVWLDGVADTVSEKYLFEQFYRHGSVTSTYIDRKTSRGLVFFESVEQAQRAVTAMRGLTIKDKCIQIDFASRDCQNLFFENMERTGQLRPGDRAEDRAARGYTGFTEYQRRPNRRSGSFIETQRSSERFTDYSSSSSRALAAPGRVSVYSSSSRGNSGNFLASAPSTPTGTRPADVSRGPNFYDSYERRESSVASSRSGLKYYDDRAVVPTPDEVSYVTVVDTYEQDLKDYGYSQRSDDALDRRKVYRCADSPSGVPHAAAAIVVGGNGRYANSAHDDVFIERLEPKSQPEWECNSRSGYKLSNSLPNAKGDDRFSSRTQRSYSPSDCGDSVSQKSRTVAPSRSRTSQSISPLHHRRSKDLKDQSPIRDYSWQTEDYQAASRLSSKESPDRFSTRSVELTARTAPSYGKGHSLSGAESSKPRTHRGSLDEDLIVLSDREQSSKAHRTMASLEDYTKTVSSDGERRRSDRDVVVTPGRTETVRSVVNLTPGWRYDSDYKTSRTEHYVDHPVSNHVGMLSGVARPDRGAHVGSGSSTPRSKSPGGSDAGESGSGERSASKGSGDEVASLEKEKYHLLSMLKELEEYSSGGSEMEGLDEEGRAVLRRMRLEEVIDLENETVGQRPHRISDLVSGRLSVISGSRLHNDTKYESVAALYNIHKPIDSRRKSNPDLDATSIHRRLKQNHIGATYDAEDEVVDLVSDSSGVADVPSADFCKRRLSAETHGVIINSSERVSKSRRSYRARWSGESAESASEESCVAISPPVPQRFASSRVQSDDPAVKADTIGRLSSSITPLSSTRASVPDDHASCATSRLSSIASSGRKGSSASATEHQPCIIPDSIVTTSGSNVRVPTEPRTVQSLTAHSGIAGRVPMSLPLPRFAYELKLSRQSSSSSTSAAVDSVHSSSKDEITPATPSTCVSVSVDVQTKEDVLAPFSPGLLSPTAVCLPLLKPEPLTPITSTNNGVPTDVVIAKVDVSPESDAVVPDLKNGDVSESELAPSTHNDSSVAAKAEASTSPVVSSVKTDVPTTDSEKQTDEDKVVEASTELSGLKPLESINPKVDNGTVSLKDTPKEGTPPLGIASDSEVSDLLSPGSPQDGGQSLEERIRALDEKLNIYNQTTRQVTIPEAASPSVFDYREKYARRRRLVESGSGNNLDSQSSSSLEQSDIVKSLLSRSSIFDQDTRRLEQLHMKYSAGAAQQSSLLVSDPMSTSLLVPQSRLLGLRTALSIDQSVSLPPTSSSDVIQRRIGIPTIYTPVSCRTSGGESDLHLSLPSPLPQVSSWGGAVTAQNFVNSTADPLPVSANSWACPASVSASNWNQNWASPLHVGCSTLPTLQTPTSQDPHGLRLGQVAPTGFCSTPTGSGPLAPNDPRRTIRPTENIGTMPALRRQDSHSSEACDAWSLASPGARRDSTTEPLTPTLKPKEIVSPPVSILKKPVPLLNVKEDSCSNNSKGCDALPNAEVVVSSAPVSVIPVAVVTGAKRTADIAFGKDTPTLAKVAAKSQKLTGTSPASSEKETEPITSDKKHFNSSSKSSDVKKAPQVKSASAKVDSKKPDNLFSTANIKLESFRSHAADEGSKNTAVKTSKSHSSSSSTAIPISKPSLPKESKSIDNTQRVVVEKDSIKDTTVDLSLVKEEKPTVKSTGSNAKVKAKDASITKDKPTVDKERTVADEKDKSKSNHSNNKHSSSSSEQRHIADKSRDRKVDESTSSTKQTDSTPSSAKTSTVKSSSSSTLSKSSSSKSNTKDGLKQSEKPPSKPKDVEVNNKEPVVSKSSSSSGGGKVVENSKVPEGKDKKTEKDDAEKTSRPKVSSSKPSKSNEDSKGSTKENSSSTKSKHGDGRPSSDSSRKTSDSKRKSEQHDKDSARKRSSSDKSVKSTKKSSSSSRSKPERREIKALLQEIPDELLAPYQSMYDMVKRRSNKEREKEDQVKAMESRAKCLSQIAQASRRRNTGSKSTRPFGSEASDDETSRSDVSRRRSAESPRTSASTKQSLSHHDDSSSDSDSSSSSSALSTSSKESEVVKNRSSKSIASTSASSKTEKMHSHLIMSSSESHNSSEEDEDRYTTSSSKKASSNKGRKTSAAVPSSGTQRTAIYTSSSSSSSSDDSKEDSNTVQVKKKKTSALASSEANNKSATKKAPTPRKTAVTSRTSSTKSNSIKKKPSVGDSDSEDDSDEASRTDKKRKPLKAVKSTLKKTKAKSSLIESSDSDSETPAEDGAQQNAKKAVSKSSKEPQKSVDVKPSEVSTVPLSNKETISKLHVSSKVDSKPVVREKDEKENQTKSVKKDQTVSRHLKTDNARSDSTASSTSRPKKPVVPSKVASPGKPAVQDAVTKPSESRSKTDEKGSELHGVAEKTRHVAETVNLATKSVTNVVGELDEKVAVETVTKSSSEHQKQTNKKKVTETSLKPPSKKCRVDRAEVEHEDSIAIRTDNIFEKMEKQESLEKIERELEKSAHHVEAAVEIKVAPALLISEAPSRHVVSVKNEVPVFLPADEDAPEPAVENVKLAVERLKEESSKEETIEEAVKAIMELTKDEASSIVVEETTPKRLTCDMDSSTSMIEEPVGTVAAEDTSDDAGELNAAIESLIEKELEPSEDTLLLPIQHETKSIGVEMDVSEGEIRQELEAEEECLTEYAGLEKTELIEEHKDLKTIRNDEDKSENLPSAAGDAKEMVIKSDVDSSVWNLRNNQRPSEENVTSFMTRLSKATADIVTDFGALRKPVDESGSHKTGDLSVSNAALDQSGRLFASLIPHLKTDVECVNGTVTGAFLTKKENGNEIVVERLVEANRQEVEVITKQATVLENHDTEPKISKELAVPEHKTLPEIDNGKPNPAVARKDEQRNDVMAGDDLNVSADLYEFKDDDDEQMRHPLHKRSRKRPGDSDSSEPGVRECTPEPKKSRKRVNSAGNKADIPTLTPPVVAADVKVEPMSTASTAIVSAESASEDSPKTTVASPSAVVGSAEAVVSAPAAVDNDSWQAHMDSVIDAVARGIFERGDESTYYATTSVQPGPAVTRRPRARRLQTPKTSASTAASLVTTTSAPTVVTSSPSSTFLAGVQQMNQSIYNSVVSSSFVLTSIGAPGVQRSLGTVTTSGKASPKIVAGLPPTVIHSPQMVVPQRMYAPGSAVMVSGCGPPTMIGAAISPGSNGGQIGYQLLMTTRPIATDAQGHPVMVTSVADEQQRRLAITQHQLASSGHGMMENQPLNQPLLVAVSRTGLTSGGAAPSPVIPMDTGHPQLRGVVPQSAAVMPPHSNHSDHVTQVSLVEQCFRQQQQQQVGVNSTGPSTTTTLRFANDLSVTSMPLDIKVSTDLGLSRVRHMSPDMAQTLIQSMGSFPANHPSGGAYMGQLGRPPHPSNYSYGVIVTPQEAAVVAAVGPRHSSPPVQSDLREALQQPSRLIQQEQLLQKQRFSVASAGPPQQLVGPNGGLIRTVPSLVASGIGSNVGGGDMCPSPISLGQHRMPFTIPEPRSAVRAEPKSLAAAVAQQQQQQPPVSLGVESPSVAPSSLTVASNSAMHRQLTIPPVEASSTLPPSVAGTDHGGGGSIAGRVEPPRSASAMLSHGVIGASGAAPMDFLMTQGVVAPIMLAGHPLVHHQEVAMQRFHQQRPPTAGLVLPFVPPSHAARLAGLPPQAAAVVGGPTATDIQQTDNLVVNTKQFTDALHRFRTVWHGHLVLKNDIATVSMHFVAGNQSLIPASLPLATNSHDPTLCVPPQLRIGQRMRLDPSQLEQVSKRMMCDSEFSMLLAVPSSRDAVESMTQTHTLQTGFINYLLQKQAAGIVNIQDPTNNQAAYVVHIFPPCSFSEQNLGRFVPDIVQTCAGATYLMIVITTC